MRLPGRKPRRTASDIRRCAARVRRHATSDLQRQNIGRESTGNRAFPSSKAYNSILFRVNEWFRMISFFIGLDF